MFINMNIMGEVFDVTFTIYLGNEIIKQFQMSAPQKMIEMQFTGLVQELAAQKGRPMRVVLSREEVIWDQFEQRQKIVPYTIEFANYEE